MAAVSEVRGAVSHHIAAQTSERIESNNKGEASIPDIQQTSSGTEFHFGYGRSKIMASVIMFFGIFLGVFSYLFFSNFIDFLPVTMLLVKSYVALFAVGLFLLGLFLVINSLTVEVGLAGIRKRQIILGFKLEEFIAIDNIADILVEQGASSTSGNTTKVWYALKAYTYDGKKIEIADSLEGQSYADEIRGKMLSALGSQWQEGLVDSSKKKAKRALPRWAKWSGKLLSHSFTVALIYDLSQFFPEVSEIFSQIKF